MYIQIDRVLPTVFAYARTLNLYNVIKKYYPRTTVDGVEVFDRLIMYTGGVWLDQLIHRKLYPILGISRNELVQEDTGTIEQMFLVWTKPKERIMTVNIAELQSYVDSNSVKDYTYTSEYQFQPLAYINPSISDEDLLAKAKTELYSIVYDADHCNPLLAMVLLDTDDSLFNRTFTLVQRSIIEKSFIGDTTSKQVCATIRVQFTRSKLVDDPSADVYYTSVKDKIEKLPLELYASSTSIQKQLYFMYSQMYLADESDIMYVKDVVYQNGHDSRTIRYYYLKTSALDTLTPKEFVKIYTNGLDTNIQQKDADPWVKVLQIIIMVIGVILAPFTDGYSLMIATALVTLLVVYFNDIGQAHNAVAMQGTIQSLGIISYVWVFVNLLSNLATKSVEEGIKESAKQTVADAVKKETSKSIVDKVVNKIVTFLQQSTIQIMSQTISFLSSIFQMYLQYIEAPKKKQEIEDKQAILSYQEGQMEEYSTPENLNNMQVFFSSPYNNIYELNEMMQNVPWLMTEGKIVNSMTKYYS